MYNWPSVFSICGYQNSFLLVREHKKCSTSVLFLLKLEVQPLTLVKTTWKTVKDDEYTASCVRSITSQHRSVLSHRSKHNYRIRWNKLRKVWLHSVCCWCKCWAEGLHWHTLKHLVPFRTPSKHSWEVRRRHWRVYREPIQLTVSSSALQDL